jgi:hypothetical protein
MIHLALVDRSLNVKPLPTPESIANGEFATVCVSTADACATGVGAKLGATKVIGSSLRDLSATRGNTAYELELSFYNLGSGEVTRKKQEATDLSALIDWAQIEALAFAGIEITGELIVTGLAPGAQVLVDDVEASALPMMTPLRLRPDGTPSPCGTARRAARPSSTSRPTA